MQNLIRSKSQLPSSLGGARCCRGAKRRLGRRRAGPKTGNTNLKAGPNHQLVPNPRRQAIRHVFDENQRTYSELRGYDASDRDVLARADNLGKLRVTRTWRIEPFFAP
jgi:hypothetical protein